MTSVGDLEKEIGDLLNQLFKKESIEAAITLINDCTYGLQHNDDNCGGKTHVNIDKIRQQIEQLKEKLNHFEDLESPLATAIVEAIDAIPGDDASKFDNCIAKIKS